MTGTSQALWEFIPRVLFLSQQKNSVFTVIAKLVSPIMTDMAIAYLSLIGSVLIFCVVVNLVWGKTIRVANMLPSIIFAVIAAYLPWTF